MARSYAPIFTSIWSDPDFTSRTAEAQRCYLLAVSQSNISYAGVISFTARRWARMAGNTTVADIEKAVQELEEHRFFVVDEDTEEILVRSFVKHNGVLAQPQLKKAMQKAYAEILSVTLRAALLAELPTDERTALAQAHPEPDGTLLAPCPAGRGQEPVSEPRPIPEPEPSSSSSTVAPITLEDDDDETTFAAALVILATRVLAMRQREKGAVSDPSRWLTKVTATRRERHLDAARCFLADRRDRLGRPATPDELADHLEPELAPRRAPRFDPECERCDGITWIETDDGMSPCPHCRPKRPSTKDEAP